MAGPGQHGGQRGIAINRRACLQVGGLSLLGLNSLELARLRSASANDSTTVARRYNSCVFIFLFGGPSHIDMWDMKPQASSEVRGEFRPIATNAPGIQLCEHLPNLARTMDKFALLRSMTHKMPVHGPACSEMYTGRPYPGPPTTDQATITDWPSISSLVTRYGQSAGNLPPSIVLPVYSHFIGQSKRIAGQTGGRMGENYNPVLLNVDSKAGDFEQQGFKLLPEVGQRRLAQRRELLHRLETSRGMTGNSLSSPARTFDEHADMAYSMLEQPAFRHALDLKRVPAREREPYGASQVGQSLLLARRFVEAGISLVTVNWDDETKHDKVSPMWDTHHDLFPKLKKHLCPSFDRVFPAFLRDLDDRGLLDTTLVVVTGEFGRTPKIGQFSQNAMTQKTGRDHWPHAFTVLLAGGGVRGGQVYGATTKNGAHVADNPVTPADLAATIFHHLGVDAAQHYFDQVQGIDLQVCEGRVIRGLG